MLSLVIYCPNSTISLTSQPFASVEGLKTLRAAVICRIYQFKRWPALPSLFVSCRSAAIRDPTGDRKARSACSEPRRCCTIHSQVTIWHRQFRAHVRWASNNQNQNPCHFKTAHLHVAEYEADNTRQPTVSKTPALLFVRKKVCNPGGKSKSAIR